jgi:uncharacterized membrane protein YccC
VGRLVRQVSRFARRAVSAPTRAAWFQASKAALSAAVAWELARHLTQSPYPIFAPLAAMLTVQATVLESLRTGIQRTLGVVGGVLLAFVLASALGLHWWSVGILVLLGLLIGQSLALGPSGSTQIAVSALLVLVLSGGSNSYAVDRVLDTLIGAAVGIVVSLTLVPPLHVRDSGLAIRGLADAQAAVLTATAESLRAGWPGTSTSTSLDQARPECRDGAGPRRGGSGRRQRPLQRSQPRRAACRRRVPGGAAQAGSRGDHGARRYPDAGGRGRLDRA